MTLLCECKIYAKNSCEGKHVVQIKGHIKKWQKMNFQKCHFLTFLTWTCERYHYFLEFFKNILNISVIASDSMPSLSLAFFRLNVITIAYNRIFYNYICDYHASRCDCMRLDAITCVSNTITCLTLLTHAIAFNCIQLHPIAQQF